MGKNEATVERRGIELLAKELGHWHDLQNESERIVAECDRLLASSEIPPDKSASINLLKTMARSYERIAWQKLNATEISLESCETTTVDEVFILTLMLRLKLESLDGSLDIAAERFDWGELLSHRDAMLSEMTRARLLADAILRGLRRLTARTAAELGLQSYDEPNERGAAHAAPSPVTLLDELMAAAQRLSV